MPKRSDIKKILVIGSGPIQIGQACEFDYSGTQALRALKKEGFKVVLVNSNPATIMTDPSMADATYIEPLTVEVVEKIIAREKPDAILPTLGGQVALNLTLDLFKLGVLDTYQVEVLGARVPSIELAEDREKFKNLMEELELPVLPAKLVRTLSEGLSAAEEIQFPMVLRPSFTLGGAGGGTVYNREEFNQKLKEALKASPTSEVLIEKSISGWKEIEIEVIRDCKDQMVVVCGIENLDPMGIHTGDSITCAPIQTLTDKEYQRLRESAKKITKGVGIETGGCNIQYALNPLNDEWVVIEMNPRVSRSSALASKATGFPIAKIAALLAVGYSMDELKNDITEVTPGCFEPAIDYVVVKIPRFTFEKFQNAEPLLGTQMKSVGEVMALGRSFSEAFLKAFQSLELGQTGLELPKNWKPEDVKLETIRPPRFDRWWLMAELFRQQKVSLEEMHEVTQIDRWFLKVLEDIIKLETKCLKTPFTKVTKDLLLAAKVSGFSDESLAKLWKVSSEKVKSKRHAEGIHPVLNQVDTCAGEFEAMTPYFYFSYEPFPLQFPKSLEEEEIVEEGKGTVVVLGSGPNRIGQGIEFDYCCVKALLAAKEMGYRTVMINCNPETVSTDYDISDRLYFEPLLAENVRTVLHHEKKFGPIKGIICQTGGQTPLRLSQQLDKKWLLGTPAAEIDRAEDRKKFDAVLKKLKLKKPEAQTCEDYKSLRLSAKKIGYPVLVRPSYVLGGRSMHIVRSAEQLERTIESLDRSNDFHWPLLVDRFLEDAIEVDVDCIGDGKEFMVLAVMEHVEEAGIHSGDSSCSLPPLTLDNPTIEKIRKQALMLAKELKVCGFLNIQMALMNGELYILEVNPRASRTVPFVCKAMNVDWVQIATRAMLGQSLKSQGVMAPPLRRQDYKNFAIKEVVFPFLKFPGVDVLLGPEMKSTGEVMGIGKDFQEAFIKGLISSGHKLPKSGSVFVSVRDADKPKIIDICQKLKTLGFRIVSTHGTARFLREKGIVCSSINKVLEGQPHIVDAILNGHIDLVINTTDSEKAISDSFSIRRSALQSGVPYFTTLTAARATVNSLQKWIVGDFTVMPIQELPKMISVKDPQPKQIVKSRERTLKRLRT